MIFLLAVPALILVAATHRHLELYAPSNILIRRARALDPRWRTVGALVAVATALLMGMHLVQRAVAAGSPEWLNVLVVILAWDALKIGALAVAVSLRRACIALRDATHQSRLPEEAVRTGHVFQGLSD